MFVCLLNGGGGDTIFVMFAISFQKMAYWNTFQGVLNLFIQSISLNQLRSRRDSEFRYIIGRKDYETLPSNIDRLYLGGDAILFIINVTILQHKCALLWASFPNVSK